MFLFIAALRVRHQKNDITSRRFTPPVISASGIEDHNPRNAQELRNHISNVMSGFDNSNSVINKAQFANINKVEYKFGPSDIMFNGNEFYRTFTLKAILLRSVRNGDGSFGVRHSTITITRNQMITFNAGNNRWFWIMFQASGSSQLSSGLRGACQNVVFEVTKMSANELTQVYNEMVTAVNNQKASIGGHFKL